MWKIAISPTPIRDRRRFNRKQFRQFFRFQEMLRFNILHKWSIHTVCHRICRTPDISPDHGVSAIFSEFCQKIFPLGLSGAMIGRLPVKILKKNDLRPDTREELRGLILNAILKNDARELQRFFDPIRQELACRSGR